MGILEKVKQRFEKQNKFPNELETAEEYHSRWRSIHTVYFAGFLVCLGFSVSLTVWPYLDQLDPTAGKTYMGYVVGISPLGQMLFSPLIGLWSNRLASIRIPMLASLALFSLSNILFSSLELFSVGRKHWMLISRLLIGISSANMAALRSYISSATRLSERRKVIAMFSLAQILGLIVGPAVQAITVPLGNDGYWIIPDHLKFNMYTAPGWLNVVLAVGNFCLFLPSLFREHNIAEREAILQKGDEEFEKEELPVPKLAAYSLLFFNFVLAFNFMIMECLGSAVAMDHFAFTKAQALSFMGILTSVGAAISIFCYIIVDPLCKKFGETNIMIWGGFFLMTIGRFLCIPMSTKRPTTYNEDYRLDVLNNLTICMNTIKINPSPWNLTTFQLEDTKFISNLCNYTEIVGCPDNQDWCFTTNAISLLQFIIGSSIVIVSFPLGLTMIHTIFSRILGTRPQGVWMGYMTGSGSLSRVVGPVLMTQIYTKFGPNWAFGSTFIMLCCSTIYVYVYSDLFDSSGGRNKEAIDLIEEKPIVMNSNTAKDAKNLVECK